MIFDRVLEELGSAIVDGTLPVGHADSVEGFVVRTGASRSIVREATRVLVSLGMLSAGRRVGLRVLAAERWDVIDPLVVRWRLAGPDRAAALDELRALRLAVEPAAAAAAARGVASGTHDRSALEALLASADHLATAAGSADPAPILPADRAFHGWLLTLSGNAMFARLQRVVERALEERADVEPDAHDVGLHWTLADAVAAGDAETAAATMREIVDRTGG